MIQLPAKTLDAQTAQSLANYQAEIDALVEYAERVAMAGAEWKRRNVPTNPIFIAVREALETICCGARRCGYCEDSVADEIDHVLPKSFYPESTFVWDNYVYACGLCNGEKLNHCAVFVAPNRVFTELQRKRNEVPASPPQGETAFIHPRFENPIDSMILDLRDTFGFSPSPLADAFMKQRARYTIDVLKLNRDYLLDARGKAYGHFKARTIEYFHKKEKGAELSELQQLVEAFQNCNYQAVWLEMKRQKARIPELKALFEEVPDALTW